MPFFVSLDRPSRLSLCNLSDPVAKERGRKEHHETVESGDTGGKKRFWLRGAAFEKTTALRSAPSKDRQIAGVYTAIPQEGKGGRHYARPAVSQPTKKRQRLKIRDFVDFPVIVP